MAMNEKESVAMFRFGVIAALVCRRFENKREERTVRREILTQQWQYPDGSMRTVSGRTLREWMRRYRQYGLNGLYDNLRKDRGSKGQFRALASEVLERAEQLRRELPERSVRSIIQILRMEGYASENIQERTLQWHLKRLNATRQQLDKSGKVFQRWEQLYANDIWHGDTAHAVWLPDPTNPNKLKRTKLIIFVDDATRVCPHAEFYFDEQLASLVDCFAKAMISHGRPRRLLLDNAFIFHSTTLAGICAELPVELSYCRPRAPQGKGKVERLIKTIRESYMVEANRAGFTTLVDLNRAFRAWLQKEYHERIHSEIKCTPLERWQRDVELIVPVTPEQIRRALMLRAKRRVQEETATISLDGEDYQTSPDLAGLMVEVRWHPDQMDVIEVWHDDKFFQMAQLLGDRPTSVPRKTVSVEEPSYPPLSTSKAILSNIQVGKDTAELVILRSDEFLALEEFVQMVARIREKALTQRELEQLSQFFRQFAPLKRTSMEAAMQQAVRVKGAALHVRYYLQNLQRIAQANRR
jgi:transposase InsO family protein